jgi:predicted AAA+ superfamily ATPase
VSGLTPGGVACDTTRATRPGQCGRWEDLFATPDAEWRELLGDEKEGPEDWRMLARRGGFPTPALELTSAAERRVWFDGYVRTYLERDLQDLAAISGLPDFRRLMRAACLRMGQLVNQTELGRDVALPQPTVHRWLNLLETSYLLVRLPAYAVNRTKRLIKAPKIYWGDTGIAFGRSGRTVRCEFGESCAARSARVAGCAH